MEMVREIVDMKYVPEKTILWGREKINFVVHSLSGAVLGFPLFIILLFFVLIVLLLWFKTFTI